MREWTHFRVHGHQGDVPDLISAMPALKLSHQIDGAAFEELRGVFVIVFLVILDGGEVFTAEVID